MATEQRLIYVDALKKAIMAEPWKEQINAVRLTVDYINIIIDEQPTIDARPVVHGRWKYEKFDIYRCTNCNGCSHVKEVMGEPDWEYCPNCGAQMDGGADNG